MRLLSALALAAAVLLAGGAPPEKQVVRILHISDTHNLHESIEKSFPMPAADVLIHSGDVSDFGTDAEIDSFNAWLGTLKSRYPHILMITGNHDWLWSLRLVGQGQLDPGTLLDPNFMKSKFSNAQVLQNEEVEVLGLKIYGADWSPWWNLGDPGDGPVKYDSARHKVWRAWQEDVKVKDGSGSGFHTFANISDGLDILVSHALSWSVFDHVRDGQWGSSKELRAAIERAQPKAHFFGHVHEQRGKWLRGPGGEYEGGVEYEPVPGSGQVFKPRPPPRATYPVDLISNNAMKNNAWLDKQLGNSNSSPSIVGPARLITATWTSDGWRWSL